MYSKVELGTPSEGGDAEMSYPIFPAHSMNTSIVVCARIVSSIYAYSKSERNLTFSLAIALVLWLATSQLAD